MKFLVRLYAVVTIFFANYSHVLAAPAITIKGSELKPLGRYFVDEKKALHLVSSACHFSVDFSGDRCFVDFALADTNAHSYVQYELDGEYQARFRIDGNVHKPVGIVAVKNGRHRLTIYKSTEAHTGDIIVQQVSGKKLTVVAPADAPMIEFVGNSITCGAAADASRITCGTGQYHDQHNAYMAYGPRVARALQVNYMLSSVSGIGIYRNWNSDGPTMPQVYEKTDFQEGSTHNWNFYTYHPRIVSIALGTNDFSNGDGKKPRLAFDSAAFVGNYVSFVALVKSKYPDAQIALLSSGMVNGANRELLQHCLTAVKTEIDKQFKESKPVATFFFLPMQARGCSGHPNVDDHAILAEQLIPFFRTLVEENK